MSENEIAKIIVEAAFKIHRKLGPGLLESVYETLLAYELSKTHQLHITRQQRIPLVWNEVEIETAFRTDIIVENAVIVELKSVETILPVFSKQVLTYLKLTNIKLGILINFNVKLLKDGIKRIANDL